MALLRLCVQKLCVHLGQKGRDINTDIGLLVANGTLTMRVQQAMDTVRIAGNESVHPGELNVEDDVELVEALFTFVNMVAHQAITEPLLTAEMYARMPAGTAAPASRSATCGPTRTEAVNVHRRGIL